MKKPFLRTLFVLLALPLKISAATGDWRTADRSSAGLAPTPKDEKRAVVQVYAARTYGWKYVAVHTWIATKAKDASSYQTFHVIGFRKSRGLNVVVVEQGIPDGKWFGHVPELLRDLRGPSAEKAIPKIEAAAKAYPYQNDYRLWPGPNSNSFTSYIIRRTPEIGIELPPNAIGKDWIDTGKLAGITETRTGVQLSLFALLGATVGLGEGIEVNLLGMSFGLDILRPALKLPFIGRVGFKDAAIFSDDPEPDLKQDRTQPLVID